MRTFTSVAAARPEIAASRDSSSGARVGVKVSESVTVKKTKLQREEKACHCMTCGSLDA